MNMATYGIDFPFRLSQKGLFLNMTDSPEKEIRANLLHLILTRRGSRYFLPDFGTRLYEFIFEPNDVVTFNMIEDEIRTTVKKYIPNLDIKSIRITAADQDEEEPSSVSEDDDSRLFRVSDHSSKPYTAKVRLDYDINNEPFSSSDFIIINI
jgi:phage baseplate assembly protein W